MYNLKKILFKNPESPAYWLILAIIIKGIIPFAWLMHSTLPCEIPGFWGGTGGDTDSYVVPINHWLAHGVYKPDFRMPGYGVVFMFFRLVFTTPNACNALIILQFLLASVTVYYLALAARNIFHNDTVFYISFYLYLISNFPNFFDGFILTESLTTSFIIFSVFFFTKYFSSKKILYLFLSSVFLGWAIFMRPGFSILLPVFALVIIFQRRSDIFKNIKYGILFLLPFTVFDGMWTYRNYREFHKIIPLSYIGNYPNIAASYLEPMFYFVQSWGGGYSFTNNVVDLDWFDYTYGGRIKPTHIDSLPDNIYTSKYNKDSLLHLKKLIQGLQNPAIDSNTANAYQRELIRKFKMYQKSFKDEKPFVYYVLTPIKLTGIILYGSYTKRYLDRGQTLGIINPLLRIFANGLYLAILLLGLTGMIMLLFSGFRQNILYLFLALIPLYTILIHAVVLRVPDNRFIMPAWPYIIICAAYMIPLLYAKLFRTKA